MLQIGHGRIQAGHWWREGTAEVGLTHASFPGNPSTGKSPVLTHCTWRGLVPSLLSLLHFGLRKVLTWLCLHARSGAALAWAVSRHIPPCRLSDFISTYWRNAYSGNFQASYASLLIQCYVPLLSYIGKRTGGNWSTWSSSSFKNGWEQSH